MMVIVKNMTMPKNCAECRIWSICDCLNDFEDYESICYAVEDGDLVRDKNCPLSEISFNNEKKLIESLQKDIDSYRRENLSEVERLVSVESK